MKAWFDHPNMKFFCIFFPKKKQVQSDYASPCYALSLCTTEDFASDALDNGDFLLKNTRWIPKIARIAIMTFKLHLRLDRYWKICGAKRVKFNTSDYLYSFSEYTMCWLSLESAIFGHTNGTITIIYNQQDCWYAQLSRVLMVL